MLENAIFAFYNYFGKFLRLPEEGLFFKNFKKNGEGANENLPFFICHKNLKTEEI